MLRFARIVLWLSALLFAAVGLCFLLAPAAMAARVEISLGGPIALSDVRAVYGGLQLGFGAFLFWAAAEPSRMRTALFAQLAVFAGLLLGRAVSAALDGLPQSPGYALIAAETVGLVLSLAALVAFTRADGRVIE